METKEFPQNTRTLLQPVQAPDSQAIVNTTKSSLLALSLTDPNRLSTDFKPGEIWSLAKDGTTGLDAKGRKKMWNKLKKEVIYRNTPEDVERKVEEDEKQKMLEYRDSDEYKERVALDLAQVTLQLKDKAAELGLKSGTLRPELLKEEDDDTDTDDDVQDSPDTEDNVSTRHEMFIAKVATAQRVMAQLKPGALGDATKALGSEPKGLGLNFRELAKKTVEDLITKYPLHELHNLGDDQRSNSKNLHDDEDRSSSASNKSNIASSERVLDDSGSDIDDHRARRRHRHKSSRSKKRSRRDYYDGGTSTGGADDDDRHHRKRHRRRHRRGGEYCNRNSYQNTRNNV